MRIILCLPNAMERDFCKNRITVLTGKYREDATVESVNIANPKDIRNIDFSDVDVIYLGTGPDCDGIGIANALRKEGYGAEIVFFTPHPEQVFEAFDVDALSYLVVGKVSTVKFDEVFRKAWERTVRRSQASIVLSCAGESIKLFINQILYFEVINRIVTVHYIGGAFEFYSTLQKIEETLKGRGFIRTHRSYLVSRRFIRTVTRVSLTLTDGTNIPIGGKYADSISF